MRRGWKAARTNARPGLVIVMMVLGVLAGYHRWPAFHEILEVVREWKLRFGFAFSAVSTGVFGGLLPVLFRLIPRETRKDPQWRFLPFFIGFWALKGIEVDALYRLQAWVFGDRADPWVVAAKVCIDQLVYCPVWAVPTMMLAYLWKDCGFRAKEARRRLGRRWYLTRCLPLLIANLGIWIPATAIIYALPLALQLPLQNLVLCLSVLLVMILTREDPSAG
jgi:hypothetical protein